ncbi:TetR family transcriptional regulator [Mycolicibacterium arenosum]|uniref:TetR family transcriptional regulator n=1 Tax=Mycolicibacterium arenosum TaxID=2952157 RepID=A0ABT1M358_9MYCO|nr:TetR family transcriptional regulator [Mycolicibacterium sp. CAU 1645]MCP9273030.1 TetR family transcriptional regulator [Mycolicibacterium sp. CAU 1645]
MTVARAGRRPRGSLTPEDVIAAAFELAQDVSLANLNMPKLAKHLDVPVTSIYWHFRKKEQLLDAMLEDALSRYHSVTTFVDGETWDESLRTHFRGMRRVFRENPVLCDLVLMRVGELSPDATRTAVHRIETVVDMLVQAGFTLDDAVEIYLALSVHSRGSAMMEHLGSRHAEHSPAMSTRAADVGELNAQALQQAVPSPVRVATLSLLSSGTTPRLLERANRGDAVADMTFEFTLDALIEKARGLLAT